MENRKMMVAKSNPILNMKNDFDLYQQRMMNLYLAKINPLDESSRRVSVSLAQFVELIGIKKVRTMMGKNERWCRWTSFPFGNALGYIPKTGYGQSTFWPAEA